MPIKITKHPKGKMYACFAFFPSGEVKKWKYVRDLQSFAQFLDKSHSSWKYFNVYDKGNKAYLKRFYPGNAVPKLLGLLLIITMPILTQKFTFSKSIGTNLENTTFNKTTFSTLINGIYYSATIPTSITFKKEVLCAL